jgi:hypothetical protein
LTHKAITATTILMAASCYAYAQDVVSVDNRIAEVETVTKTRTTLVCEVKVSQHKYSWRFCHDGKVLQVLPFWSAGETTTKKQMVECPTLESALEKIEELGLIVTKDQAEELAELQPVPKVAMP